MHSRIYSTLVALLLASTAAYADTTLNLTPGVSPLSHDIYELHMTIFYICVAIGLVVFGVMFYSIFKYRKSRGAKAAEFHSHFWLEIAWSIVPFIILVLMAIPATKVLLHMKNTEKSELTIHITGYQWKWQYQYLEDGVSFFSNLSTPMAQREGKEPKGPHYLREVDHPLVLPIHKKIRFLATSNDVNHAWWVPDLGVKQDAIAGYINEAWTRIDKPGIYYGQCAELCGVNHAFMPIVVIAMTEEGYKEWVAQQKGGGQQATEVAKQWKMPELMQQGEKVYQRICSACHQPNGAGAPPTFPALQGSKVALGPVDKHIETVMNGVSGTAMQAFKNQLNDVDLASVITYERNAFGNNTGTLVQPIQIKALRDGKTIEAVQKELQANAKAAPAAATTTAAPPAMAPAPAEKAIATAATAATPTPAAAPAKKYTMAEQMAQGEKVYTTTCAVCHQPGGTGMPPTFPALKGGKIATGPVDKHIHQVLFGVPGTAMQAFKDQLSNDDIAAVVTYERNAWGNNTGTVVQPADVQAGRQQTATTANQTGGK